MFYGGRLISHLSAKDALVDEFISLRRMNRYSALILDSDRSRKGAYLNATKRRLIREFREKPGFAWATAGREIENYVPPDVIKEVISEVHPKAAPTSGCGQFDRIGAIGKKGQRVELDKMSIARRVVARGTLPDTLDRNQKVKKLAKFIQQANGD